MHLPALPLPTWSCAAAAPLSAAAGRPGACPPWSWAWRLARARCRAFGGRAGLQIQKAGHPQQTNRTSTGRAQAAVAWPQQPWRHAPRGARQTLTVQRERWTNDSLLELPHLNLLTVASAASASLLCRYSSAKSCPLAFSASPEVTSSIQLAEGRPEGKAASKNGREAGLGTLDGSGL